MEQRKTPKTEMRTKRQARVGSLRRNGKVGAPETPRRVRSKSSRRFDGQVAIVVGGAQGIGRAIALRLATEGATVAIADIDRHPEALQQGAVLLAHVKTIETVKVGEEIIGAQNERLPIVMAGNAGIYSIFQNTRVLSY